MMMFIVCYTLYSCLYGFYLYDYYLKLSRIGGYWGIFLLFPYIGNIFDIIYVLCCLVVLFLHPIFSLEYYEINWPKKEKSSSSNEGDENEIELKET